MGKLNKANKTKNGTQSKAKNNRKGRARNRRNAIDDWSETEASYNEDDDEYVPPKRRMFGHWSFGDL